MPDESLPHFERTLARLRTPLAVLLWVAGVVLAACLRIDAASDPLWLDELHTAWCADGSFQQAAHRARVGNQSPLYFYLCWALKAVAPDCPGITSSLRLPSLIASMGLVISVAWIVYAISKSVWGSGLAVLLTAIDENAIYYGVEARPYAMVQLVAVWQVFLFLSFLNRQQVLNEELPAESRWSIPATTRMLVLVVLALILFYLHYTTLLLMVAEVFVACLWLLARLLVNVRVPTDRATARNLAIIVLAGGLLMVPGLWQLFGDIGTRRNDWLGMANIQRFGLMTIAALLIYLGPTGLVLLRNRSLMHERSLRLWMVGLSLLVALPFAMAFVAALTGAAALGHERYTIASGTLLLVLAGVVVGALNRWPGQMFAASVATLVLAVASHPFLADLVANGCLPRMRNEDWGVIASHMQKQPADVLLFSDLVEQTPDTAFPVLPEMESYFCFPLLGPYQPFQSDMGSASKYWIKPIGLEQGVYQVADAQIEQLALRKRFWLVTRNWPDRNEQSARHLCRQLHGRSDGDVWHVNQPFPDSQSAVTLFQFYRE